MNTSLTAVKREIPKFNSKVELNRLCRQVGKALGQDMNPEDFTFFQPGEKVLLKPAKIREFKESKSGTRVVWNTLNMSRQAINAYLRAGLETPGVQVRQVADVKTANGLVANRAIEVRLTDNNADLVPFYAKVQKILDSAPRRDQ
jgi:hypothetical protein